MSEPYLGEIRMFAGTFAPQGWALCDGQLIAVSQNDALFSLFGTIYGGDGRTTFGLPDLRGRVPIHHGSGPGLTNRRLGVKSGTENETISVNQIPSHSHTLRGRNTAAALTTANTPTNELASNAIGGDPYAVLGNVDVTLNSVSIGPSQGGSQTHTNLQPYLCINFIVALVGIYPSRT